LAYVNKGLLAASTSNTHLKAGIPYSTPLISGSGHKDSLSRLGNAMQIFRKQIKKKIALANESIGFTNTVSEVIARSKN
jgi:hypothetical protein